MVSFNSWLDSLVAVGYNEPKARSRIAHDVVLMAMEKVGWREMSLSKVVSS